MKRNPRDFIDGVLAHVQSYFCDASLGTVIKIRVSMLK